MKTVIRWSVFLLILATGAERAHTSQGIAPDYFAGMKARSIGPAGMSGRIAISGRAFLRGSFVWVRQRK
jgi:hypothetical protein